MSRSSLHCRPQYSGQARTCCGALTDIFEPVVKTSADCQISNLRALERSIRTSSSKMHRRKQTTKTWDAVKSEAGTCSLHAVDLEVVLVAEALVEQELRNLPPHAAPGK